MQLYDLSIREMIVGFKERRFSPVDVWHAIAARIEAWEPSIKALYAYDPKAATAAAEASAKRWRMSTPLGELDGVPVTVKELIATTGVAIPRGSAALLLEPALMDAPPAARLREAGAIIFAKTTAPDFGMLSSGLSSFHGITRNPWDLTRNPGGSSSGAGAAGAARCGPLHIGTDIGGSVRLPAAWCGLVGFKPSHGRIPIEPYFIGRCAGPMTRTVEDAAIAMRTLALPDPSDATSLPPSEIEWTDLRREPVGLRIGVMLDVGCGMAVDPEIEKAVLGAAARFEAAGAIVVPVGPIMDQAVLDGIDDFWRARLWSELRQMSAEQQARVLPYIMAWASAGADLPGWRVAQGLEQTYTLRRRAAALFQTVDAVLSPTAPIVSFAAESASPLDDPARPFDHICFTLPWNMSDQPAISINGGRARSGMPIGLQLVGPRFADLNVLRLAKFIEDQRDGDLAWPEPPSIRAASVAIPVPGR